MWHILGSVQQMYLLPAKNLWTQVRKQNRKMSWKMTMTTVPSLDPVSDEMIMFPCPHLSLLENLHLPSAAVSPSQPPLSLLPPPHLLLPLLLLPQLPVQRLEKKSKSVRTKTATNISLKSLPFFHSSHFLNSGYLQTSFTEWYRTSMSEWYRSSMSMPVLLLYSPPPPPPPSTHTVWTFYKTPLDFSISVTHMKCLWISV